ncbi:MAG TPA: alpha/beta fold hydrolase [Streptosporangiaceae bacterium]|nr:alpha/beta fold hydrolase [Streptosporangiaceae bacterium]
MALTLAQLLDVRFFKAFDLDNDGRMLAGSDDTGSNQLIEILPDGTSVALTALPGACTGRYLPGERAVIVSHDEGGNEQHQLSLLRLPVPSGKPAGLDDLEPLVHDPNYMHVLAQVRPGQICYFVNRRNGVDFDPVIRQLADGSERQLVLADAMFDGAAISPDGRWLALTVESKVTAASSHVVLVDLSAPAGQERMAEVTPADAPAMNGELAWSPDSASLYFSSSNDREFLGVARYEVGAGRLTWLVSDYEADLTGWLSPDGSTLLVERNVDGASALFLYDAVSGEMLRELPLPDVGTVIAHRLPAPRWAPDSVSVALSISGPALPGDILLAERAPGAVGPRMLTRSAAALGGERPVRPELHRVPTPDGEVVPCMVYRAADSARDDLAGSAVLLVHGGPEAQSMQNFDVTVQALAGAGHTVLVPNVRGSTGYGKRWYSADDVHRRLDSVADLAALHSYLPKLDLDQERAALWGGSYGGYMVLAGLAFQPELWAAGVDIVGIASLVTFLENTSAYRRAYREREYGTLARDRELLHSVSPLTRIDDMRAPLFIIHGANDPRVPLSEAEQIHAALTSRGRECELLVYGDEGHGLAKRTNRADALPKAFAFLARHLAVVAI